MRRRILSPTPHQGIINSWPHFTIQDPLQCAGSPPSVIIEQQDLGHPFPDDLRLYSTISPPFRQHLVEYQTGIAHLQGHLNRSICGHFPLGSEACHQAVPQLRCNHLLHQHPGRQGETFIILLHVCACRPVYSGFVPGGGGSYS